MYALEKFPSTEDLRQQVIDYIAIGVGCNCLISLWETDLLTALLKEEGIGERSLNAYGDATCLKSALITLEKSKVVQIDNGFFTLTRLGKALVEYMGLITIFFDGYGDLIAKQIQIAKGELKNKNGLIKGEVVSRSSIAISRKIYPQLLIEIEKLHVSGSLCDLGCGYATTLRNICDHLAIRGLGFEREAAVVAQMQEKLKDDRVEVQVGDVTQLHGVWEDVEGVMQCHLFHDFFPLERCACILDSYQTNFPNMKHFYYIDSVAPSSSVNEILPGFDYVHGLLGIPTRTKEETRQVFQNSSYELDKEISIRDLPSTFLWILTPK